MHQATHEAITRFVLERMLGFEARGSVAVARGIHHAIECSSLPDRALDIWIDGQGFDFAGARFTSLCHFQRTDRDGYDWREDRSVPKLDLPNRAVRMDRFAFGNAWPLCRYSTPRPEPIGEHPAQSIARRPADETTWPSASIMASWLGHHAIAHRHSPHVECDRRWAALGSALHFVQDCCIEHHARGELLNGHLAWEGELAEIWQRFIRTKAPELRAFEACIDRPRLRWREPNVACILNARFARRSPKSTEVFRRACESTAQVVRWARIGWGVSDVIG